MADAMQGRCESCPAFVEDNGQSARREPTGLGYCHRYPPQVVLISTVGGLETRAYFPKVSLSSACLEHPENKLTIMVKGLALPHGR